MNEERFSCVSVCVTEENFLADIFFPNGPKISSQFVLKMAEKKRKWTFGSSTLFIGLPLQRNIVLWHRGTKRDEGWTRTTTKIALQQNLVARKQNANYTRQSTNSTSKQFVNYSILEITTRMRAWETNFLISLLFLNRNFWIPVSWCSMIFFSISSMIYVDSLSFYYFHW